MQAWIIEIMEQFGYIGILLLILVENIFPPIPSEVILTFGGFMTTKSQMVIPVVILMATIGSVLGAIILYGIGRILDEDRLIRIVEKHKILGVEEKDIKKVMNWYRSYQYKTVFFCRMIPIVRSLISIPAGIGRMSMIPFLLFTTLGSLIWNTLLVAAGAAFGTAWEKVVVCLDAYSNVTYGVIGSIGMLFIFLGYYKKRKKHN